MKNLENLPIEKRIKLMEAAKRLNQTCHEIKEESGRDTTTSTIVKSNRSLNILPNSNHKFSN